MGEFIIKAQPMDEILFEAEDRISQRIFAKNISSSKDFIQMRSSDDFFLEEIVVDSYKTFMVSNPKDRKSTRLNSSHVRISYAVFCLKKKNWDEEPDLLTLDYLTQHLGLDIVACLEDYLCRSRVTLPRLRPAGCSVHWVCYTHSTIDG